LQRSRKSGCTSNTHQKELIFMSDDLKKRLAELSPEKRELLLAKLRKSKGTGSKAKVKSEISPRKDPSSFPMSFGQKGFWVMEQLNPGLAVSNIPSAVRLKGMLDVAALEKALHYIVSRHQILRVNFRVSGGQPEQIVRESLQMTIPVIDLHNLTTQDKEKRVHELITTEATRPFDIAKDTLVRVQLLRLAAEEHVLSVTFHHIVADAWSVGVFIKELLQAYQAFRQKQPPSLPPLPLQYFDYAEWHNAFIEGPQGQKQIAYWEAQLAEPEGKIQLPADFPAQSQTSHRGQHIPFAFGRELSDKILAFCQAENITPYMFLQAMFALFLAKLTNRDDIRIGSPVANRDKAELKDLIGLFINVVIIKNDLSRNIPLREFLTQVRKTVLDAMENATVPIEILINKLFPQRDSSENPLSNVLFDFQNAPLQKTTLAGLEIEPLELESGTIKFDLVLSVNITSSGINGIFGYKTELFKRETIERFIRYYRNLVQAALQNPQEKIWRLPLLDKTEAQFILEKWSNRKKEKLPENVTVVQLFEEQVALHPEALALKEVKTGGNAQPRLLTYAELNRQANRVANFLRDKGIGPGKIVGLSLHRSPELFVALLGILKSGAAYLPIDPNYPDERIEYVLQDSGVTIVLTQKALVNRFSNKNILAFQMDADRLLLETQSDENPYVAFDLHDLAYLIYTSGSTGKPKAVMAHHLGLLNHACAMRNEYALQTGESILQYISISFDAAAEEIYPALISGATLVLPGSAAELSGFDLLNILEREKIKILHVPVPVWHYFIDFLSEQNRPIPESIRLMLAGGEQPSLLKLRRAAQLAQHPTDFVNLYGPTETTIASTFQRITLSDDVDFEYGLMPIGIPIQNNPVYLLDREMQPVPQGVLGEIYIGGLGVTRGYLNRPDLTAERFLPDPFCKRPGARMYRTGDLGRFNSKGEIVFAGRVDFQVKIRGFRIELGEIEAAIEGFEGVKQCVVFAQTPQEGGEKKLVAYIVPQNKEAFSQDALRAYLSAQLPDYMVPSFFVLLDQIPLTPTGKVDRRALPDPTKGQTVTVSQNYVPPQSKLEKFLYEMWKEILGIERIGIHDNFFQLGGSSIQAATFVNRLQDALGEYVYIVAIYDAPTIADLVQLLKRDYPDGVYRITGERVEHHEEKERIGQEHIDHLRRIIKVPAPFVHTNKRKNPPAVFVFSSPRSGSTLTRAILGGHPKLFSPPELQLLNFNTLQERKQNLTGRDDFWLDGTIRAIMAIKNCTADEAREIMAYYENKDYSVQEFYREMQDWLGDRLFVDKTPNYALSTEIMQRAEEYFEDALYIHLIRHPYGVIPSFEKAKLHVFYPPFFTEEHPYTPRQLAELIWTISHQNILTFLKGIPKERQFRLYYEDLVTDPEKTVKAMCDFLRIDLHPDMLEPQKDSSKRMTDGLNDLSKMLGDVRFHEHKGITADRAYSWKKSLTEDYLGDITWQLVEDFGYENRSKLEYSLGKVIRPIEPLKAGEIPPLSFAQQRLWFLDQLEPDNPFYNMPMTVRLKGKVDVHLLEQAINKVCERHENLRTAFKTVNGQPQVDIAPFVHVKIERIDLSTVPKEKQEAAVKELIRREASKPFALERAPLFRTVLARVAADEYIFILNMHHIISDGMSLEIMVKEISLIYRSLQENKPVPLPELAVQYGAFAKWQREWLESSVLQKQLQFWQNQLMGVPHLLQLPVDFPRPRVQSYKGSKAYFQLSESLSQKINEIANRHQTTPYVVLLTAFSVLLHRYSGQNDLVIGTPVSGRTRKEIEGLIGFFVNSLPLRFELDDNPDFDTLVERVGQMVQNALSNQDVPFEKIIDALNLERDTSYTPLFQVMFIYQQNPLQKIKLADLEIEPLQVDTGTSKFDLSLALVEDVPFRGMIEYNTDLFKAETIRRFIGHFENLLHDIAQNTQKPVRTLKLLSPEETRTLIETYGTTTSKEIPAEWNVVNQFERIVRDMPRQVALLSEQSSLTYEELNRHANRLAHYLMRQGVQPGNIVALSVPRSPELFVGMMGILKTGAAYLPIDPEYPQERIDYILEDSGVKLVLTTPELRQRFARTGVRTVFPEINGNEFGDQPDSNPAVPLYAESPVYLIYTSGSTGKPKAVVVPHGALINHALFTREKEKITPADRILQYITISFDASGEEIFPSLISGATLFLPKSASDLSTNDIYDLILKYELTVLHIPVPVWHVFIDYLKENHKFIPASLRLMMVGGEQPSIPKFHQAAQLATHAVRFVNVYGPTETTISATYFATNLEKNKTFEQDVIPIGIPITNVRIYILDEALQPVPQGVVGEIYIAGKGVTLGYLNRPDLTAERFLPDPFGKEPGARMYRTGDLGRLNSKGEIIFSGRADFQVKIRGFRVELGEIENALKKHPAVNDVIVLAQKEENRTHLVAYIIPEKDRPLTIAELRDFLKKTLPDYMVPTQFVALDRFPTTSTGKIDRKRFPKPQIDRSSLEESYQAPRNEKEKILVEIWQELLKLPKVGVKDNFFELGGDSILSIQVIARANQKGLKITPKQLFEYPTIEGLAAVAEEGVAIHAEQGVVSGSFPLIPIQRWFFDLKLNKPEHWNQSLTIRLNEALDTEILSRVVQTVLQHHDLLRATFVREKDETQGQILQNSPVNPFYVHDLTTLSQNEREEKIRELAFKAQSGFKLTEGPLIRFDYFKTGENDLLQITVHHLVVDTVSWRILSEDILQAYQQLTAGKEIALPPKTTSFKYWAEKLKEYAQSEAVGRELDFWREHIEGDVPTLPLDDPQGENTEKSADSVKISLSKEETQQLLREAPAAYNTQINELLLAALLRAHYRWSGENDLLIDLESHGREDLFEDVNISRTVGWFTVSHPLRLKYDSTWQTADLIRRVKETYRAVPNHGIGYGLLRYLRNEADALQKAPLAPIGFNYLGQFDQEQNQSASLGEPIAPLAPERAPENQRIHLLEIGGNVIDDVLNLNISFSKAQFKRLTIERFARLFAEELQAIIAHCLSPEAGGYTASDFSDAGLDDEDLDALLDELE